MLSGVRRSLTLGARVCVLQADDELSSMFSSLSLPVRNPYIPSDLSLRSATSSASASAQGDQGPVGAASPSQPSSSSSAAAQAGVDVRWVACVFACVCGVGAGCTGRSGAIVGLTHPSRFSFSIVRRCSILCVCVCGSHCVCLLFCACVCDVSIAPVWSSSLILACLVSLYTCAQPTHPHRYHENTVDRALARV